jgi:hypothetical protein
MMEIRNKKYKKMEVSAGLCGCEMMSIKKVQPREIVPVSEISFFSHVNGLR